MPQAPPAGAAPAGAAGVTPGVGPPVGGEATTPAQLAELQEAIAALKLDLKSEDKKKSKKDKSKKKDKKDKKAKKKKKKRSESSSSSSRSSRSRSGRSSSSSSGSSEPLRWRPGGASRSVSSKQVNAVDLLKFKKRGDLINFAAKAPGALTAHFINACRMKMGYGAIERSGQLRSMSLATFAQSSHHGLTEVRDQHEVLTLMTAMDHINKKELSKAMDVLSMRVCALQRAKSKGGSWERAQQIELISAPGTDLGPSALGGLFT